MLVRIIDDNGYFLRDDFTEEITKNTIETPCPQGFHLPKWNGTEWVEGKTASELALIETARQVVVNQETNKKTIEQQAITALTTNKTFLAITPTTAQVVTQTKALTRQINGVIRLILNQLEEV